MINKTLSKAHIAKLIKNHKGMLGLHHSEATKQKIGLANKNKVRSTECRNKLRIFHLGKSLSPEHRRKIGLALKGKYRGGKKKPCCSDCGKTLANYYAKKCNKHKGLKGKESPHWRGGGTPLNQIIRTSIKYKTWRKKVFERDNYICQLCKKRGGIMNADHIKPFSMVPSWRFRLSNGRTLCVDCHKKTDTYGYSNKMRNYTFLKTYNA